MYYTYLLKLSNNDYYAGSTKDIKERLDNHQSGTVQYASKFRPIKLVWCGIFTNKKLALNFEKYLKSSSGKAFRNKHLI